MSLSLCWVEVPDHGASVSVKCRHHKTVPSSHHPTWYQGYHRYLDISIYLHSDTRHLSAEPPCHNPLSRVTCHAGADADSARVIMNLSSGSCLNAPLAPALLFQCWYLQLQDGGNHNRASNEGPHKRSLSQRRLLLGWLALSTAYTFKTLLRIC